MNFNTCGILNRTTFKIYIDSFVSDCQVLILGLSLSTPFVDRCPISGDLVEPIKYLSKSRATPVLWHGSHNIVCYGCTKLVVVSPFV